MPHSHHSHSGQFCRHAKDTLEEVIQEAIRQGFEVFGLSEHAPRYRSEDLFPEEADMSPVQLQEAYGDFLRTASRLREEYRDKIDLLIGIETDYITPLDLDNTTALIDSHESIDYVVGSVHHVHGISIDFDKPTWVRAIQTISKSQYGSTMTVSADGTVSLPSTPDSSVSLSDIDIRSFLSAYFDAQYEMMRTYQPEVIGHFDLCLLWIPDFSLKGDGMDHIWEKIERNVRYAVNYGALFEANAAAIRKGWKSSYPSPAILELILSLNGRICLSDDSHGIDYVALNYGKMKDYLVNHGVKEVYHLVRTVNADERDVEVGHRGRVKARRVESWENSAFWNRH